METTFTELRCKEVVNALTGKILGNICDVVMDLSCNRILGFVVPGSKIFFNLFKPSQEIFIPFSHVRRIGEDIILVEIAESPSKKQKNKAVRVFEVQKQADTNTSKPIYERNESIYPASNYMTNDNSRTNLQAKNNYQNIVSQKSVSNNVGQGSYPIENVSSQSINTHNLTNNQSNLYNSHIYENSNNIQNPMTNFDQDDVYPLN